MFIHLMGHTGGYSREDAIEAIDDEGTLPDMLTFNPSNRPSTRTAASFTDDVIDYRLAFLTKGECPPSGLSPHTDTLTVFPYLGPPAPDPELVGRLVIASGPHIGHEAAQEVEIRSGLRAGKCLLEVLLGDQQDASAYSLVTAMLP